MALPGFVSCLAGGAGGAGGAAEPRAIRTPPSGVLCCVVAAAAAAALPAGTGRRGGGAGPRAPVADGGNARVGPPKATGTLGGLLVVPVPRPHVPVPPWTHFRFEVKCVRTARLLTVHNTR